LQKNRSENPFRPIKQGKRIMEQHLTIGEAVDRALAKAAAEMNAGRAALATESPAPEGFNPFSQLGEHLAEAIDALLDAADSCGGIGNKRFVLKKALARHNIEISE
jgi:hypothetical protein